MKRRLLETAIGLTTCMFALNCAHADVYAWVDATGSVTLSDLPPPAGVRVISVINNTEPASVRPDPSAERESAHRAEVQALSDRVRQLERQVELATYQPPPVVQYAPASAMWPSAPCSWADCGPWYSTPGYPIGFGVVFAPSHGFHRSHRFHGSHGTHLRRH